ncbi:Nicotinamide-nucleotide amidohydrolase PncC [Piscirickettsia salmonis]|uniref:Competence/damage-inducible protein CinA n=1 Tax=Piscirickettsia salmonis TaxID=1238 RepID=A0A1L6TBG3_PISSA|nr:CinA family protein [Piscirickettsia salmonis]AKP73754.1 damage-inducible protein CinA [Piscirickettsia salmonis LF-89 = ATCC VR-1361]ALB22545.1 competence/damage-inducible protein CinA [Piscirickettsia salmonis]ALY02570.1 damage-inducible protein CinA [Piscirickettsia salmonis]AMA42112.1 damage-inducible protein CinA [Piscirickettsia salmonis]AOS34588.1 damage-inducible protein CinA [Piscirickettsia salmonis]
MEEGNIHVIATELGQQLKLQGLWLVTAESCTAGLIAGAITDVAGSSAWFERGFVTYSNRAKHDMLDVPYHLLEEKGAVSEEVVRLMSRHACERSGCAVGVAASGIAGPDGGSIDKPVGTVWLSWCVSGDVTAERYLFAGNREEIRLRAVHAALTGLLTRLS